MANEDNRWNTVIIGAGQAGLAAGYFLKEMGSKFIILDMNDSIGDSWRKRWDSLLLFTPSQYDGLPGMPFPAARNSFPDKDEMAGYLEKYAARFSLPVRSNVRVINLNRPNGSYEMDTTAGKIITDNVIVATGTNPIPRIPAFASDISEEIFQLHSSGYKNPGSLPPGDILVVGAGTSGIEIAIEISDSHKTIISGNPTFHIPDNLLKYGGALYWWLINNILTVKTPIGKKARSKVLNGGSPLIRISASDLDRAGITRVPKVSGVSNGKPLMEDGTVLDISGIIWATGFRPDFSWIDINITDETGWPVTERGVSLYSKGLYFNGMPFQFGLTSGLVGGVGRDAEYISKYIRNNLTA
jgi:putative flavoprotein involved in K+ transport